MICVLLAVPSAHAAFGPWDLDLDTATQIARTFEHHVVAQSDRLAIYVDWPVRQLRALVDLPVIRELTRTLGLREIEQVMADRAPVAVPRPCPRRS